MQAVCFSCWLTKMLWIKSIANLAKMLSMKNIAQTPITSLYWFVAINEIFAQYNCLKPQATFETTSNFYGLLQPLGRLICARIEAMDLLKGKLRKLNNNYLPRLLPKYNPSKILVEAMVETFSKLRRLFPSFRSCPLSLLVCLGSKTKAAHLSFDGTSFSW